VKRLGRRLAVGHDALRLLVREHLRDTHMSQVTGMHFDARFKPTYSIERPVNAKCTTARRSNFAREFLSLAFWRPHAADLPAKIWTLLPSFSFKNKLLKRNVAPNVRAPGDF